MSYVCNFWISGHRRSGSCDSPYLKTPDSRPQDRCDENANVYSEEPSENNKTPAENGWYIYISIQMNIYSKCTSFLF